jgi:SAM-dependent methyltransferase
LEKNYPYKDRITALGIGGNDEFKKRYPEVKSVVYSGGVFPFKDKAFDVGWSNAVLEHVGTREAQILFLKEMKRVTNRAFITTPNKLFPIEVHTRIPLLHIVLPKKWFDYVVRLVGKGWASGNYMHLITLKRLREYLKEAGITEYTIIKNRIGFFTLDFVIIF